MASSSYKGVVVPPSLTKTAGGQDMYVPFTGGSGPTPTVVSQILAGTGVTVSPTGGTGNVTVTNSGVTQLVAGTGVTLSPAGGTGAVTVNGIASQGALTSVQIAGAGGTLEAVNGVTVATTSGIMSTNGLVANGFIASPYTGTTFPPGNSLYGTYSFPITLPAASSEVALPQIDALLASRPHIIAVTVVSTSSPTGLSCGAIFSACGGLTPIKVGASTSNLAANNLLITGTNPGALVIDGGTQSSAGPGTVYVTVLA